MCDGGLALGQADRLQRHRRDGAGRRKEFRDSKLVGEERIQQFLSCKEAEDMQNCTDGWRGAKWRTGQTYTASEGFPEGGRVRVSSWASIEVASKGG